MVSLRLLSAVAAVLICVPADASSLTFDVAAAKNRPVTKVINLLKDMLKQLEKEAEEDEEIYDKMACWCETNDKEKTKSIADAEAKIASLTETIEALTGETARLETEIKQHEKDIDKEQTALAKATSIREKQLAAFNSEEKDLLESIAALGAAITVLSKHHENFLQVPKPHMLGVAATLQHEMATHSDLLKGVLTHSDRRAINSFIQQDLAAPASGEIYGILKQMKESFESNLSSSQKEELSAQTAYQDLKAAKETEIATVQEQLDRKTQRLADAGQKLAQGKQDKTDTEESLSADEAFLMNLKEKCSMTDKEWEQRQKERATEMEAVSKALAILSSDDSHDLFTKTFNAAFLQTEGASAARKAASEILTVAAQKLHSWGLASVAMQVRLDAFTKVKAAIDKMIGDLNKQQADEVKHRDFCVKGFNDNQLETEKTKRAEEGKNAEIADLTSEIDALAKDLATLKSEIAEMQVQLKRAGEDREKENNEFQTTIADQRATQKLLQQALEVLQAVYAKKSLLQGPPPPQGFKKYEKSGGAGGVMGLIEQIIADAKAMENDAIKSEEDAQTAYESFVKESNTSIEAKGKSIITKSDVKAKKEGNLVDAEKDLANLKKDLEHLSNEDADLHSACDFTMKNFDIRQEARSQEIEALRQAKAILSGAKFD